MASINPKPSNEAERKKKTILSANESAVVPVSTFPKVKASWRSKTNYQLPMLPITNYQLSMGPAPVLIHPCDLKLSTRVPRARSPSRQKDHQASSECG